ncbi:MULTISPECIES: pectate lyase [Mucilaginibacter]|nr:MULTISPECIES: pectate lyase [Mucilaginibacter]
MQTRFFKSLLSLAAIFFVARLCAQDLRADNMLRFQRPSGGWFKQFRGKAFSYNQEFSATDKTDIAFEVLEGAATIDNNATNMEIRYLVKIYKSIPNPLYLASAERGIRYLLKAQYPNGGFPQYYPDHGLYRNEITYNDNAMINALNLLMDVALGRNGLDVIDRKLIDSCRNGVDRGIRCILNTQIIQSGRLTGWCQQYDERTLQPAKARAYELPSVSGSESVGIIRFLMDQPYPTQEMKASVKAAVQWLNDVKIVGYKVVSVPAPGTEKGTDKKMAVDPTSIMWARYYEIGTDRPFFCNRDGIKVYTLQELSYERRNGYAWYGNWPEQLLAKDYPDWLRKWN